MLKNKWENFFLIIIVLSIIQLFLEEFATIGNWLVKTRHILIYIGALFDVIFTVEFIIRLTISARKGKAGQYFKYERGWIDLLASVPLLLFYSGPMVYYISKITHVSMITGITSLRTLKLIKIVRITRVLRLLRVLKIFGKISKSATKMVRHHIATITTTALASLILGLFLIKLVFGIFNWPGIEVFASKRKQQYKNMIKQATVLSEQYKININQALVIIFATEKRILNVSNEGREIFEKYEPTEMLKKFDLNDLSYFKEGSIGIWFQISDINKQIAKNNIEVFLLVLFVLGGLLLFYSGHFIKYIALPLDAIQQKITDPAYSPQLQTKKAYEEDEVYEIFNILGKKDNSSGGY